MFTRRKACKIIGLCSAGMLVQDYKMKKENASHLITLSFDDGFEKSTRRTAEIYEKCGLKASINVIATAHEKDFKLPNEYHRWPAGDFHMWNDLKRRGHEIMPHSYKHINLTQVSFEEAEKLISKCLEVFREKLEGFNAATSIYNFAHNASTPEIENWLNTKVRAYRTSGLAYNSLPFKGMKKLTCISMGPENIDKYLDQSINTFLNGPPGWFIFNTHGLDDEGWGPMSAAYLDELLDRLVHTSTVEVIPAGMALDKVV